mmetsp:Transcript_22408/g.63507  ORF Transcript_22408/g.63507 Transcript_22408/m.63507 type:complete len:137 (-) Transcript_22408:197-607(-)
MLGAGFLVQRHDRMPLLVFGDFEWEQLLVALDRVVVVVAADQSLDVKEGPGRILRGLVLGGIPDQSRPVLQEGNVGRGDTIALLVGADVDPVVPPHADARVRRPQVDADAWSVDGVALAIWLGAASDLAAERGCCS